MQLWYPIGIDDKRSPESWNGPETWTFILQLLPDSRQDILTQKNYSSPQPTFIQSQQWKRQGNFSIVNFEQISHSDMVFLLLSFNK